MQPSVSRDKRLKAYLGSYSERLGESVSLFSYLTSGQFHEHCQYHPSIRDLSEPTKMRPILPAPFKAEKEIQSPWLSKLPTQKIKLGSESQQLVLCAKRSGQRFVAKVKVKSVTETIIVYWARTMRSIFS
jgi:hypothetical protein